MKKFWLLVSLVTCGVLLAWCFEKVEQNPEIIDDCNIDGSCSIVRHVEDDRYSIWRKLCIDNNWTLSPDEYGRDIICVLADDYICPLSDVANWVCQWINYPEWYIVLMKWNEKNYDENSWKEIISEDCEHFFDGCNHCKRIVDWELVCSDLICEKYGEPECTDFILEDMQ